MMGGKPWENGGVGRPKGSGKVEIVCELLASRMYTHREIAEKTGLSVQRVHDISSENRDVVRDGRARHDELVRESIETARERIVSKGLAIDKWIVDNVATRLATGEIKPKLSDHHKVARRYLGNKKVEERVLKLDPATVELMERVAAEIRLPLTDASRGQVIDTTAVPVVEAPPRALPPAPSEPAIERQPQRWSPCVGPTSCGGGYRCPAHA